MDIYIFEDSSHFENLSSLNIELTLTLQFFLLDDLFKLYFFTTCLSIFTAIDQNKEQQKSTCQIFLKDITEERNLENHKHSWLSMVWIFKKLNSFKSNINYLQSKTTFWANLQKITFNNLKLSLPWTNLCFILIISLYLFRSELLRVNCSCSHFFSSAS